MAALGDFGGFNDGIVLIPLVFMQIYSRKMYLQHLFTILPIKRGSHKSKMRKSIEDRFTQDSLPLEISENETAQLAKETERMTFLKNSYFLSLCFSKCLCRKNRSMRLQEKAAEQFHNQLDIRSLVKTRIDLSILLNALLNRH